MELRAVETIATAIRAVVGGMTQIEAAEVFKVDRRATSNVMKMLPEYGGQKRTLQRYEEHWSRFGPRDH